jgi:hypothetical protein
MHDAIRNRIATGRLWRWALAAAKLAFAGAVVFGASSTHAQTKLRNDNISIDYYEPRNPNLLPLYRKLQERSVLERLSEFLAPVHWPKKLRLITKQCEASTPWPYVFYSKLDYSLTICYQWFGYLSWLRPPPAFATRQQVIVGGLVGIVLHESARAAFDMLAVPVLGSESYAADQAAIFVALQFGDQTAQTVVKGTYFVWKSYDNLYVTQNIAYNFADPSSVPRQRMYNTLCMAYGGAPALFKNFIEQGDLLPASRAAKCGDEYHQVSVAFDRTIAANVNKTMMQSVHALTWITADDLK